MSESTDMQLAALPVLEVLCRRCDGEGVIYPTGDEEGCDVCDGTGYMLTSAGRAVVRLVEHRFHRLLAGG